MGIDGLLRNLRSITVEKHISEYKGKTVAVDTYSWLHKIIKSHYVLEVVREKVTNCFVHQVIKRIQRIRSFGVKVIMVLDGAPLPGKQGEERQRAENRAAALVRALQLQRQGDQANALRKFSDSIDITPELAHSLVRQLISLRIDFVVAPYQADAQLAYLSRKGIADVIITEDSDLLAFGAYRVFYKMDHFTMMGEEVRLQDLKNNKEPNFTFFNNNMFLTSCILSGCDYLPQITGVGIKTAHKIVGKYRNCRRIMQQLRNNYREKVPLDYEANFVKAFLTFRLQPVYCPQSQQIVNLYNIDVEGIKEACLSQNNDSLENALLDPYIIQKMEQPSFSWDFLYPLNVQPENQIKAAKGLIHPITYEPFAAISPAPIQLLLQKRSKPANPPKKQRDPNQFTLMQVVGERIKKVEHNRPIPQRSLSSQSFEVSRVVSRQLSENDAGSQLNERKEAGSSQSFKKCKSLLRPMFPPAFFSQPAQFLARYTPSFKRGELSLN